jgi:heptaprenylglyceryl phosphate synthase
MRNVLLSGALLASAILGGIVGGGINQRQQDAEIEAAWDNVVVVRDGTLIANPAAYATDPEALADGQVVIISKGRAAANAAMEQRP